jgi:hypothetical protein
MKVYRDIDSLEDFNFWSGAEDRIRHAKDTGKWDELNDYVVSLVEDVYPEGLSATDLNDLVWFDEEIDNMLYGDEDEDEDLDEMNELIPNDENFVESKKLKRKLKMR